MLTHIRIRNFKRFDDVGFDLGSNVVFIGPNNSGKTTALQALALWDLGVKRWIEKRQGKQPSERRIGVAINRRDLISIPVPDANLLWRDLHVRNINRDNGSQRTQNVRIDIIVQGVTDDKSWECGLEFDYANEESLYCRPLRLEEKTQPARMEVPAAAGSMRIAYLPPMSGLAAVEPKAEQGRINVLIGEGQTAQVLRNLCYQVYEKRKTDQGWQRITQNLEKLFGVTLLEPIYIQERGEILMSYEEAGGLKLDLSSSGRGLQQTLLLLAYLYANPRTVLLLDEPDAHLEVLRQRQIYQLLTETAQQQGSQVIAASHSEVVLNEAASRDIVIAFVGKPHRMGDRSSQILKALTDLGFDQYYQAEQTGWVLYLEGSTDLAILYAFAEKLNHSAKKDLERAFVHYVSTNTPQRARDHFYGLLEAKPDLIGYALFDRLDKNLATNTVLVEQMWQRKEIENYLCHEETLMAYAQGDGASQVDPYVPTAKSGS
jgi:ABC-type lipoprotein export system ATPase subunit